MGANSIRTEALPSRRKADSPERQRSVANSLSKTSFPYENQLQVKLNDRGLAFPIKSKALKASKIGAYAFVAPKLNNVEWTPLKSSLAQSVQNPQYHFPGKTHTVEGSLNKQLYASHA